MTKILKHISEITESDVVYRNIGKKSESGTVTVVDDKLLVFWETGECETYNIPQWIDSRDPHFYVEVDADIENAKQATGKVISFNRRTGKIQVGDTNGRIPHQSNRGLRVDVVL